MFYLKKKNALISAVDKLGEYECKKKVNYSSLKNLISKAEPFISSLKFKYNYSIKYERYMNELIIKVTQKTNEYFIN